MTVGPSSSFFGRPSLSRRLGASCLLAAAVTLASANGSQNAIANGDTRTLTLYHAHRQDSGTFTFRRWGSYDQAVLKELSHFLRDWRNDASVAMDPKLFDVVWAIYRETGSDEPVKVMSAFRSPSTNGMLRRRSRGVAKNSQHMAGRAMDVHIPGVSMGRAREIGLRLQHGGIGFYPSAGSSFIHVDTGTVRHWPRVTREHLARIFPDGKTVHIPSDGKPMDGYERAYAEIEARGGSAVSLAEINSKTGRGLFAFLFGGGEDDEPAAAPARGRNGRLAARGARRETVAALPHSTNSEDAGIIAFARGGGASEQAPVRTAVSARAAIQPAPDRVEAAAKPEPLPAAKQIASLSAAALPRAVSEARVEPAAKSALPVLLAAASIPLPPQRPADFGGRKDPAETLKSESQRLVLAANIPLPPVRGPLASQSAIAVDEAFAPKTTSALAIAEESPSNSQAGIALRLASVPLPPARPRALEQLAEKPAAIAAADPKPVPVEEAKPRGLAGLLSVHGASSIPAAALSFAPALVPLPPSRPIPR